MLDIPSLKAALKVLDKTIAPTVISPPITSLPAIRARYLIVLIGQMVEGEITYRQIGERLGEWDKKNAFK